MDFNVKEEIVNVPGDPPPPRRTPAAAAGPPPRDGVIDLSSSDSDFEADEKGLEGRDADGLGLPLKKVRSADSDLPLGFLDPLPPEEPLRLPAPPQQARAPMALPPCKHFWKAGDFDENPNLTHVPASGMDHVRVHPKFLHSNATSHKWALGALAELLDNSLDEVCNGATFVNIDMLINKKNESKMLLVEDNGGGMDPDKMRQCMSLGYSAKSKITNTIGQYGNGFKTSTMRIGADVIVFSRSRGKDGRRPTQSIGLLSYTFLRSTGKEDIVVPMLDYEKGKTWNKILRSSFTDWNSNLDTIVEWSPYSSETDLLQEFSTMKDQGTRIIIYNLWEDDQGELELDFDTDKYDIQIRGVNRDEKNIEMAKKYPNSRHFLTYRHSLRSYASILYLRLPHVFRMLLRGKEIEHHNVVNDMMLKEEVTYRPQSVSEGIPKDPNMVAVVTVGFVKDAKHHIDIQGFNVYHKNRLIKPFWRVWSSSGSDGRGVIGVLEANFVEPAHDKQDFERTTILSRLEARLVQMQKQYWSRRCDKIGYAPRIKKRNIESEDHESSPEPVHQSSKKTKAISASRTPHLSKADDKVGYEYLSGSTVKAGKAVASAIASGKTGNSKGSRVESPEGFDNKIRARSTSHVHDVNDESDDEAELIPSGNASHGSKSSLLKTFSAQKTPGKVADSSPLSLRISTRSQSKAHTAMPSQNEPITEDSSIIKKLKDENEELKKRIINLEKSDTNQEMQQLRKRNKSLSEQVEELNKKLEAQNKEQEALIDIFSEERNRRDKEEENMRKKLKDASGTIQELLEKLNKAQNNNSNR